MAPAGMCPPCTHSEGGCTSQFRSLVKISSLARSSWFHSSSSFSCPFQLSLSCSLVLNAAEQEQPLGQDQAYLSSLLLTLPGQDSFQVALSPHPHTSSRQGGWRMLEAEGCIYGPRQATKELPGASHNQGQHNASFRLLRVLQPLHRRDSAGFLPASLGLSKLPSQLPGLDLSHTERSHTAAVACPHPFRRRQAPHCGSSLALER